ncbi:MAG: anthranilate phosphoribosyltransferase [Bacteroidetes bacterium SW_4_67_19]|nr:MAG: anthranilate phosphoribosyltransferase [Bacteroidetes bacterium SW_4_67_19]
MKKFLQTIAAGKDLTREEARAAMRRMMRGDAEPEHVAGLLLGLRARGESLDELVGFTEVMREFAVSVDPGDPDAIDLCGTGGDDAGTFNISTAAALVTAGAGATVAKHGNRSVSSDCGSADVLEALGVKIDLEKDGVEHCLQEVGIAFLFAPHFHPAMRHVMPVRRALGVRTFFNVLGPLCNPAGVKRQLVGAFSASVAQQMMRILAETGSRHVCAVHSRDGLDEVSLSAPTALFEHDTARRDADEPATQNGRVIQPEVHGVRPAELDALQGGDKETNARILESILDGSEEGAPRDVVLLNAAYALHVSGRFDGLEECTEAARESIASGAALEKLQRLGEASHSFAKE